MKTTLNNIRRSPYQALAAILVTSLTLFIISIFIYVSLASQVVLNHFETKPQIIAYLKDSHTQEQANQLINSIKSKTNVQDALYISKDQALEIYKESVGNDPLLLGSITELGLVTAEILPASIEVTAKTPKDFDSIVEVLKKSDLISTTSQGQKEIDFPKDIVGELTRWTHAIRVAGIILISALSLTSILTIMIIISLKIASRRVEIGTLKLLGAQNKFVLKPYLLESIIYGLSGAFTGWLLSYIFLLYSTPFLSQRLGNIIAFPVPFLIALIPLGILIIFSLILSLISSFWAVLRFLKR
jgi:cell division transport system permease protein